MQKGAGTEEKIGTQYLSAEEIAGQLEVCYSIIDASFDSKKFIEIVRSILKDTRLEEADVVFLKEQIFEITENTDQTNEQFIRSSLSSAIDALSVQKRKDIEAVEKFVRTTFATDFPKYHSKKPGTQIDPSDLQTAKRSSIEKVSTLTPIQLAIFQEKLNETAKACETVGKNASTEAIDNDPLAFLLEKSNRGPGFL